MVRGVRERSTGAEYRVFPSAENHVTKDTPRVKFDAAYRIIPSPTSYYHHPIRSLTYGEGDQALSSQFLLIFVCNDSSDDHTTSTLAWLTLTRDRHPKCGCRYAPYRDRLGNLPMNNTAFDGALQVHLLLKYLGIVKSSVYELNTFEGPPFKLANFPKRRYLDQRSFPSQRLTFNVMAAIECVDRSRRQ